MKTSQVIQMMVMLGLFAVALMTVLDVEKRKTEINKVNVPVLESATAGPEEVIFKCKKEMTTLDASEKSYELIPLKNE